MQAWQVSMMIIIVSGNHKSYPITNTYHLVEVFSKVMIVSKSSSIDCKSTTFITIGADGEPAAGLFKHDDSF